MSHYFFKLLGNWLHYLPLLGIIVLFFAILYLPPGAAFIVLLLDALFLSLMARYWRLARQTLVEITLRPAAPVSGRIERSQVLVARAGLAQLEAAFQQAGLVIQIEQIVDLRDEGLAFVCAACEDVLGVLQEGGRLIVEALNWPGAIKLAARADQEFVVCYLLTDVSLRSRVVVYQDAWRPAFASLEVGLLASDPFLKETSLREIIDTLTWHTSPLAEEELDAMSRWADSEQGTIEVSLDDAGRNRLALDVESHSTYIAYRLRWTALENRLLERLLQDRVQWRQVVLRPSRWTLALRRRRARFRQMGRMAEMFAELPEEDQKQIIAEMRQGKKDVAD